MKKYNKTGKVSVYFMVGPSGMVTVEKAESEVSIVEYYEVEVPVKEDKKNDAKPDEASSNPDEEADAEAMGEGDAAKEKAGGEENVCLSRSL